jgi:hypothetical protein
LVSVEDSLGGSEREVEHAVVSLLFQVGVKTSLEGDVTAGRAD